MKRKSQMILCVRGERGLRASGPWVYSLEEGETRAIKENKKKKGLKYTHLKEVAVDKTGLYTSRTLRTWKLALVEPEPLSEYDQTAAFLKSISDDL